MRGTDKTDRPSHNDTDGGLPLCNAGTMWEDMYFRT